MYFMCALILFPIALAKHLMKKYKIEKKKTSDKKTADSNAHEKPPVKPPIDVLQQKMTPIPEKMPLIQEKMNQAAIPRIEYNVNDRKYKPDLNKKIVVFDIESDHSDKELTPDQESHDEEMYAVKKEANHILNDKPWLNSQPSLDRQPFSSQSSLKQVNKTSAREKSSESSFKFKSLSNLENQRKNQTDLVLAANKAANRSATTVYYESNV